MSAEQPAPAASSADSTANAPEAIATLPTAVTLAAPEPAAATSAAPTASEIEAEKRRLKIGSQRDGSTAKVPPRVITEFKTPAGGVTPPKQVFVSLDQAGKFQPLAAPNKPVATAPAAPPAPREQRPPQPPRQQPVSQQHTPPQLARSPRHEEQTQDPSGDEAPATTTNLGYRPKPAPLTANVNAAPKAPVVEKQGPRIAPPNLRDKLGDDLEAELAAALGEGSLNEMIESTTPKLAGTEIEQDSKQKARVLRTSAEFVFVDLPGANQGAIPVVQFEDKVPEPGTILEVIVRRFLPEEGFYDTSMSAGAVNVADWSQVSEGIVVAARITGHNKGGLEAQVSKLRGFIPAGQISLYRVEDLAQFVGQTMDCLVTEANPERRNLVLSRKAVLEKVQEEARGKLLAELEVGQEREGIVRSLRDFGAFVDLGGVDGLIHISQMSWDRVKHPSDVLKEGEKVKVKVQKFDTETGKISLSLRDLFQNPWETVSQKYPVTSSVTGKVTRVMDFGAFVRLESGVEGLVHVSELSHKRVWRPSDVLQEGQEVEAKVLSIDQENQRMSLSIKALEAKPEPVKKDGDVTPQEDDTPAPPRPAAVYKTPLKGGLGKPTGGESVGLKW
jgi:predicted RNA-binding protein with RPS1 domain